jgi:hypothetical protein
MPIHDWTAVSAGTWHDFHVAWISELRNALNSGLMPPDYYAQAEQIAGPFGPDVLTLQASGDSESNGSLHSGDSGLGGLAVAVQVVPPRAKLVAEHEMNEYARKRNTLVIRHSSGDDIVALIELVSPGNKEGKRAFAAFLDKALEAISQGYHLLIVDLFPPSPRDPRGIHDAIWNEFTGQTFTPPLDAPLTLAAYSCGPQKRAYVESTAVGRELLEMPLFLKPELYVNVPLEPTYRSAYRGVPRKWKTVLDATIPAPRA